jgi:hypothetical protein
MTRATRLAVALLAVTGLVLGATPRLARAEPPNPKATPVYVLLIQTDDADDQAEALTQAMRTRVRQAAGWSLLESQQSFETLAIALKCPPRPDAPCLQRIADQLHADHYVWGSMGKKKAGEVRAELHLWGRGRGDVDASESFSDNLKEASDPSVQQIAARLFGTLTGGIGGGTLVIHAGTGGGAVLVDGVEKAALDGGVARVDVGSGPHTIAVRVPGFEAPLQQATVAAGAEQELSFTLAPAAPVPPETHSSFPLRKVATYTTLVAGGGLLIAGGVEGIVWLNQYNTQKSQLKNVPPTISNVCVDEVNPSAVNSCQRSKSALTTSTLGWVFGAVGAALAGTGVYLLASDSGSSDSGHEPPPPVGKPRIHVVPEVGTRSGGVDLSVSF